MKTDVSVIIVNYNTYVLTTHCIRSVIQYSQGRSIEIILVDNNSTECDPARFLEEFPRLKLVKNPVNSGFAAGNNRGIEEAGGEYILLLNSDTVFREDSIGRCLEYIQTQDRVAVLGCRMVYPDNSVQYTARRFRSVGWELLDLFRPIPWMMSYPKRSRLMLGKYFRHDETLDCDWLNGAFFLFPRMILEGLPGKKLDERFFMYGEDQLWCWQTRELGYRCVFYSGTTITHINSGSTDITKQLRLRNTMMKHEREIMRLRKGKGFYYFLFNLVYTVKEGTRNGIKSLVFRLTGRLLR